MDLLGPWIVPPVHRDRSREVAYATDGVLLYRRVRSGPFTIYHHTDAALCSESDFEPWKRAPNVDEDRWHVCSGEQAKEIDP